MPKYKVTWSIDIDAENGSEAHKDAKKINSDLLEPKKVVLALLKYWSFRHTPPKSLNTHNFKRDITNYYTLLRGESLPPFTL